MRIQQVKLNLLANLAGRFSSVVLSILFVPYYAHYLGSSRYGIVGLSASLQAFVAILDVGLSATLNRELARLTARTNTEEQIHDLVFTLQLLYWAMAIAISVLLVFLAAPLAPRWFQSSSLPTSEIQIAIALQGLVIAAQFPGSLYSGGLLGLQQQVLQNVITVFFGLLRSVGLLILLSRVSATLYAFFLWQLAVGFLQSVALGTLLWFVLPKSKTKARWNPGLLQEVGHFAATMAGISVVSALAVHADKVLLSRLLGLENFGRYSMVSVAAGGLYFLNGPVYSALLPQLTSLVATNDESGLQKVYHRLAQWLAIAVFPAAAVLSIYSRTVLFGWTGRLSMAENNHSLLTILAIATALHCIATAPFALQTAFGTTRISLEMNLVVLSVFLPLLTIVAPKYGAIGAAFLWMCLNFSCVLISGWRTHKRHLPGDFSNWFLRDVCIPFVLTFSLVYLLHQQTGDVLTSRRLAIGSLPVFGSAAISIPLAWYYFLTKRSLA